MIHDDERKNGYDEGWQEGWNKGWESRKALNKRIVQWQYCKDPNQINDVLLHGNENWDGLISVDQIISISWNANQGCYEVFWKDL